MAQGFDAPPTLERSGSERRGGAVSSLSPEGERVGVRGGALFKGKEGRGDFRKNSTGGRLHPRFLRKRGLGRKWSSPCRIDGEVENSAL